MAEGGAWKAAVDPLRPPVPVLSTVVSSDSVIPALSTLAVASHVLDLSVETRFSAAVLLHRTHQAAPALLDPADSGDFHDRDAPIWIIMACIFLACKTEEEPRRLRDVINCAFMISYSSSTESEGGAIRIGWMPEPPELNQDYWKAKETIVAAEQRVLRWLAFDVMVSHPHRAVSLLLQEAYARNILLVTTDSSRDPAVASVDSSDDKSRARIHGMACRRLNDAIFDVQALQHGVLPMACAAITLACADDTVIGPASASWKNQWWREILPDYDEKAISSAASDLQDATNMLCKWSKRAR